VWEHKVAIDDMLEHYLKGWQMSRLSRVDRQILRLATFEMVFADDVPAKVAVNEAIDLAKHFGTEDSGKFVNGVLGKMIQEVDTLKGDL
jgi:transcription antitermination protein NusB